MGKKYKDVIWNFLACDLPKTHDIEILSKIIMLNLLFVLCCFALLSLGFIALYENNIILSSVDFVFTLFFISLLFRLRKSKEIKNIKYLAIGTGFLLLALLVAIGGVNQTAFVWSFTFPLASIFLLGKKHGFLFSISFLLTIGIIFILGHQVSYISNYSNDLIIRYITAFFIITLFSMVMETTRSLVQRKLTESNEQLKQSLQEVKALSGLLPICSSCKNIRDDKGYWTQIETYITKHSDAQFSHSLCNKCADELYGNEPWYKKKGSNNNNEEENDRAD